ncbi:QRFP-like peptide receptor [Mercenaria mercenaria]|uniref:QRFP-like peptide receptor n=1 Tax=Mercenaria mercenaria TaxID=6596 RepID=UPI00234E4ECD|nr:QRFP-like peptide receptor [Mercenaria mercenaria]
MSTENKSVLLNNRTAICSTLGNNSSSYHDFHSNEETTTLDPAILQGICKLTLCTVDDNSKDPLYVICERFFGDLVKEIERDRLYSQTIPTASKVLLSILTSLMICLSLCGNSLVVMTFAFNKYMRSVTNVFILSLAISDLMVTFTCIPMNMGFILKPTHWLFGRFGCKLMPCITQLSVACSSLTLCCIAFDRYYAIVHPLKLKFLQTTKRATILQVVVWCVSAASTIPYAFFYDTLQVSACKEIDEEDKIVCVQQHHQITKKVFDIWVSMFVLFYGPFLFMSILYGIICYKLWAQRPVGAMSQRTYDVRLKLKRKAIKMLITVVFIFIICWSPLLLFNVIANANHVPTNVNSLNWRSFLQCLALSSTCWNPLVYAFMNEKFRKAFRTLLTCRKAQIQPVLEHRMSTESRKTTTQLEMPVLPVGSRQTSETKA